MMIIEIEIINHTPIFVLFSVSKITITKMGPIYYEYGSMVITFLDSESACYAYELLKNCKYEEKNLLGESSSSSANY